MTAARNKPAQRNRGQAASFGRFMRMPDVVATTGLAPATIYRLIKQGQFPNRTPLTVRCVGWWESDVEAWITSRRPQHTVYDPGATPK